MDTYDEPVDLDTPSWGVTIAVALLFGVLVALIGSVWLAVVGL